MKNLSFLIRPLQTLRWPIRYKLGLAFGLILFCFIGYGLTSAALLLNSRQTQQGMQTLDNYLDRAQRYQQLFDNEVNLYSDSIFFTHIKNIHNTFRTELIDLSESSSKTPDTEADQVFEKLFAQLYLKQYDNFLQLDSLITANTFDQAQALWHQFEPEFRYTSGILATYTASLLAERKQAQNLLDSTFTLSIFIIIIITLVSIALGLFMLFLIGRVLVQPLNQLEHALGSMAEGDLTQHVQIYNRDEIGSLAENFGRALSSVQQVVKGVGIGESLQTVTGQLVQVSQQQASGAVEQVTSLAEVINIIEELNSSARVIADRAVKVAELTVTTQQQIDQVAQAGRTSEERTNQMITLVANTLIQIESIGQRVNEFTLVMNELNEQAESISRVVNLLSNIAEEVHLLALNASIEAAGAGAYGDRFQVIAREIRQLANRASQANNEAVKLISTVQISSRMALAQSEQDHLSVQTVIESNDGMKVGLAELSDAIDQVKQAVGTLQNLSGLVTQQTIEIQLATEQQSQSSQMVIVSARSVGLVAEQTANNSEQLTQSSDQLANLTFQLKGVLNGVRLAA